MKKIIWCSVFVWLLISGIVFAGVIVKFNCNECGAKFSSVAKDFGFSGVENTVIYCKNCKDFYAIPTNIVFETENNKNAYLVKSIGKKEFLGAERLVYPCPKCRSEAFAYSGPTCPVCGKGMLQEEEEAMWD